MLLILLSLVAADATASGATTAATADDPIICTRQNTGEEVGTRLQSKKVCMKKSDRDAMQKIEDQKVREYINNGNDRMRFAPAPPR